jgi:hypothetical protein
MRLRLIVTDKTILTSVGIVGLLVEGDYGFKFLAKVEITRWLKAPLDTRGVNSYMTMASSRGSVEA